MPTASSQHAALEKPDPPDDPADDAYASTGLHRTWTCHQGVEVEMPAVEPVNALLKRRDRGVGTCDLLGTLALEVRRRARVTASSSARSSMVGSVTSSPPRA